MVDSASAHLVPGFVRGKSRPCERRAPREAEQDWPTLPLPRGGGTEPERPQRISARPERPRDFPFPPSRGKPESRGRQSLAWNPVRRTAASREEIRMPTGRASGRGRGGQYVEISGV